MTETVRIPEADGGTTKVSIVALSRVEWSALLAKHPPRERSEDRTWNEVTFPVALIAASTGLSRSEAAEWWEAAAEDQQNVLFEACLRLSSPGSVEWAIRRLRANPRLLAEVQTASKMGIAHEAFLEWPSDSQDYAIAFAVLDSDRCPGGCGVARHEMRDPTAYAVGTTDCLWCDQREKKRAEIKAEDRGHRHVILSPKG